MVIELTRDDIAKAIESYVRSEILDYRFKEMEVVVTQGKAARATVSIAARQEPLPGLDDEQSS